MDWENERYVRLYVRDTDDWLTLTWEAKALFPLMLRKVDRAGTLQTKRGAVGVAAQTGLPLTVVEAGLADLERDGCVTKCDAGYVFPNFLEAQEARQSDKQRAKEARARRRDLHVGESRNGTPAQRNVTPASQDVTEPSHDVTPRHTASHGVTLAVPSHAVPSHAVSYPKPRVRKEQPTPEWALQAGEIWSARVGPITPEKIGKKLKGLVTQYTWDRVRPALEVYCSDDEGPGPGRSRKPEWFVENFHTWRLIAETPIDDGMGALTDRGKRLLSKRSA